MRSGRTYISSTSRVHVARQWHPCPLPLPVVAKVTSTSTSTKMLAVHHKSGQTLSRRETRKVRFFFLLCKQSTTVVYTRRSFHEHGQNTQRVCFFSQLQTRIDCLVLPTQLPIATKDNQLEHREGRVIRQPHTPPFIGSRKKRSIHGAPLNNAPTTYLY